EWDIWQKTTAPSDSLGRATSFLQSPTAGEKIIWAIVGGDTLETIATVIFLANDATEIDKFTEDSGDGQTGNVGTVLRKPFVIQITDGFNPVPYGPVYFSVLGDKGEILGSQPVVSDSIGLAKAYLKLDATPGVHYVQVSSPGLSGSPTFSATGKVGQASGMDYPYEGYDYDLEGTAGEVLPVPFVVKVFDDDGLAVAGEEITFIVDTPGSDGAIVETQPVSTDEYGYASAYYRMQKKSDTLAWIKATHSSFQYFVWYKAVSQAGRAKKLEAVSSIQQTAYIGSQVNLKVRVTDNYGNPRSGVTVQFEITDGTAVITHGALVETDISGEASAQVLLGFTTGPVKVWASGTALEGSPVEFSVDVITSTQMAEDIIRFPQTMPQPIMATVNEFLVDS
ncbi:Ig-like domain-containing protein, partial [bacterium]|nr:Ig-like domain-containing protein [bacterium]